MKRSTLLFLLAGFIACSPDKKTPSPQPTPTPQDGWEQWGTPYADVPDTRDIVLYEINPRSFSQSGDFQGIIDRLTEIKALGVNTIWLMPIYPIGKVKPASPLGSPYAVQDYLGVNPEYGDLEKLRELVSKAHDMDMAVILDWVANHTAWDNPWMTHKSWYQRDQDSNVISPPGTNWLDVAQLNFNNSDMRKEMIHSMKYWIMQANVDGFRCDAADFVPDDFWTESMTALRSIEGRKLILLAEGSKASNFQSGFEMNYAWNFQTGIKNIFHNGERADAVFAYDQAEYQAVPTATGEKLRYITNHDIYAWEETPQEAFNTAEGSLAAFVITANLNGVPLIYAGQEIAYPQQIPFLYKEAINWSVNPSILAGYKEVLNFRKHSEVLKYGAPTSYGNPDVVVFKKTYQGQEVLVLVNVRNQNINFNVNSSLVNSTWTDALNGGSIQLSSSLALTPYQYLILEKQ